MNPLSHIAIFLPADADKVAVVNLIKQGLLLQSYIDLKQKSATLFSSAALDSFLEEEFLHGKPGFDTGYDRPLHSLSSGEQKKVFLQYLLLQQPNYFILDEVYDHLDTAAQAAVLEILQSISQTIPIIQIFHRQKEILPFINQFFGMDKLVLVNYPSRAAFLTYLQEQANVLGALPMPAPLHPITIFKGPLVEMKNLFVSFDGKPILKHINWQINPGEFWQLVGPNGSGKSTLLSLITGDSAKGFGQDLFLFGIKKGTGESVWDIKQKIGYFNASLTQHFSRQDAIEKMVVAGFFDSIGLYIKPSDQQMRIAHEWLRFIGLYPFRTKPIQFLPLAQQRMVLIARAMVKHPPLLILDEPTAGLDDAAAALITTMIQQIARESKTAIIYVSHSREEGIQPNLILQLYPSNEGTTGSVKTLY